MKIVRFLEIAEHVIASRGATSLTSAQQERNELMELVQEMLRAEKDRFRQEEMDGVQSLDELARAQGVGPVADPAAIVGDWDGENLDEFVPRKKTP